MPQICQGAPVLPTARAQHIPAPVSSLGAESRLFVSGRMLWRPAGQRTLCGSRLGRRPRAETVG